MRLVAAFIAGLFALVSPHAFAAAAAPTKPVKIVLGYTPVAETVAAYAALKEGYFREAGLDVQFLLVNNSAILANSLVAKSIDVASITPSVFLQAVDNGIDFTAFTGSAIASGRHTGGVIVREGVNVKGPQDFIGKKVAVSGLRSATHIEFVNWLEENNVDPKKVRFLEAPFPAQQDLLKSGSVDATLSIDPFLTRTVNAKVAHVVTWLSDKIPLDTSLVFFAGRGEWVKQNPAIVKAFRAAVTKGIAFVDANPAKAHDYVGEMLKLPKDAASQTEFGKLRADLAPTQLQWWIDVMLKQKLIRNKINAATIIAK